MIYLASPYSHEDPLIMKTRFLLAEQATAILLQRKAWVYSPVVHCHELAAKHSLPTNFAYWQEYNIDMLRRCDAFYILAVSGWKESKGVTAELTVAQMLGLKIAHMNELGEVVWPA